MLTDHEKELLNEIIELCRYTYDLAVQENPPSFAEVELAIRRGLIEGMAGGEAGGV